MSASAADAPRIRVLVVDDDPLIRKLLGTVLADADLELAEARDGTEALELARAWRPDAMIVDVMMPGLDGYDLCRALRADPETAHVRIVVLTARVGPNERDEAMRAGADAFFTKPFSPLDLMSALSPSGGS